MAVWNCYLTHVANMKSVINFPLLFCISLLMPSTALALSDDRNQPVHITADSMLVDERKGISHYHGDVHMQQGSLKVDAEDVVVHLRDGKINKIVITGEPARLIQTPDHTQEEVRSRAGRMVYNMDSNLLTLYKDAEVQQGQNRFSGERIEYNTISSQVTAKKEDESSGRVRAIIVPKTETEATP